MAGPTGEYNPISPQFGLLPQNQPLHPVLEYLLRAASIPSNTWGGAVRAAGLPLEELEANRARDVQSAIQQAYTTGQIPTEAVHQRSWLGQALQSANILGEPKPEKLTPSETSAAVQGANLRALQQSKIAQFLLKYQDLQEKRFQNALEKFGPEITQQLYGQREGLDFSNFGLTPAQAREHEAVVSGVNAALRAGQLGGQPALNTVASAVLPRGREGEPSSIPLPLGAQGSMEVQTQRLEEEKARRTAQQKRQIEVDKRAKLNLIIRLRQQAIQRSVTKARMLAQALTAATKQATESVSGLGAADPARKAALQSPDIMALKEQYANAIEEFSGKNPALRKAIMGMSADEIEKHATGMTDGSDIASKYFQQ